MQPASIVEKLSKRRLQWDLLITAGSNFGLTGLGMLTGALVARSLGPIGRGQLAAIQLLPMLLVSLGTLGIENGIIYYSGRKENESGNLITSAWLILLPSSLVWAIVGFLLLPHILRGHTQETIRFSQLTLLALPFLYVERAAWVFQGTKRFDLWAVHRIPKPVFYFLLVVGLILLGAASPYSIAVGLLIINLFGPVVTLVLLGKSRIQLAKPSLASAKLLTHYGIRSILGSVPEELNLRIDQFFIVLWLSEADLGIYAVAVSWSLVLNPLIGAVGMVAFPHIATRQDSAQKTFLARSVRTTFLSVLIADVLLLVVTPIALPLVFGASFRTAVPVALVLIVANSVYALKSVLGSAARGLGFPEGVAYAEILALGTTFAMLFFLLPSLGIIGAGIASLVAYSGAALILAIFVNAKTQISLRNLLLIRREDISRLVGTKETPH